MKRKELPKARNPFVLHLSKRPAGAHGKTKKAQRRADKMALKQMDRYPSGQRELTFNQSH